MNEYTNIEKNFIINNYQTMSAREIAKKLDRTLSSVQSYILKIGIHKPESPNSGWSEYEIEYLKNNFFHMTAKEISKVLNRTEKAIKVKASKLGLKNPRKYYLNEDRFFAIDTEEDAYWLGFLYADGYVCYNSDARRYYVGLELKSSDKKHLSKLNKYMESNSEIKYKEHKSPSTDNMCYINYVIYNSKKLSNNLISNGCTTNKTRTIRFPFDKMPRELYRHFIRGYFDGDGSISFIKTGNRKQYVYPRTNITCGSVQFLNDINMILRENKIEAGIYKESKGNDVYKLQHSQNQKIINFLKYIYDDSKVYLDRKYDLYIKIVNEQS